jgi:hypothetical protein
MPETDRRWLEAARSAPGHYPPDTNSWFALDQARLIVRCKMDRLANLPRGKILMLVKRGRRLRRYVCASPLSVRRQRT